jgi:hypothetical protein
MITTILNGLIWYTHNGDEVAWNGKKYISLLFEGEFDSLEEIDEFCEDYIMEQYLDSKPNMVTITRDMAIDAGDRSLEGQTWKW